MYTSLRHSICHCCCRNRWVWGKQ